MSDKLGLVGRKVGMTRIFTEEGVFRSRDGARCVEQPSHSCLRRKLPMVTTRSRSRLVPAVPAA